MVAVATGAGAVMGAKGTLYKPFYPSYKKPRPGSIKEESAKEISAETEVHITTADVDSDNQNAEMAPLVPKEEPILATLVPPVTPMNTKHSLHLDPANLVYKLSPVVGFKGIRSVSQPEQLMHHSIAIEDFDPPANEVNLDQSNTVQLVNTNFESIDIGSDLENDKDYEEEVLSWNLDELMATDN